MSEPADPARLPAEAPQESPAKLPPDGSPPDGSPAEGSPAEPPRDGPALGASPAEGSSAEPPHEGPPAEAADGPAGPNPRTERAVRGTFAATLALEALVVLLVPRTIAQFGSGLVGWKLAVLLGLAGLFVVAAALVRHPAGLLLGTALQVALVGCGFLTGAMFVLGAVFAGIWVFLLRLRRDLLGTPLLG